jgi:aspartyl/asparaginyl beta-hydroxylase (cupin superfamily)
VTASTAPDARIRELVQLAERANASGKREEARRLVAEAQGVEPEHPVVLNAAAVNELHDGDAGLARTLLERAIAKDAANASLWVNLAAACRRLGLADEEARAIERALAIEPRHLLALLQKASLLEARGKVRAAASTYGNALATIPPGARLPEQLRVPLQRAMEAVRRNAENLEALLMQRLQALRTRHAGTAQERFEHCLDVLLGKRRIYDPAPTFMRFPKVPALEFYPRELFEWLPHVEAATADVRTELERVLAEDAERLEPYIAYPEGVPIDQWKELNHSRRWSAFYLWREGRPIDDHLARCPRTAELLSKLPLAGVPDHAPTAFFSVLDAKSRIPPHTGVTNTRVIVHLPLVVPPGCGFRVGSDTREWRPGQAWVFDDTLEHEAWNESDVPRGILIFDVWNPFLTAAERDLVRETVAAVGDYYRGESELSRFT